MYYQVKNQNYMINKLKLCLILLTGIVIASSCEKDSYTASSEAEIFSYRIIDTETEGIINSSDSTILLNFPTGMLSAEDLIAEFDISEGAMASIGPAIQESGKTSNNYEKPLTLQIIAEDDITVSNWQIIGINNDYTFDWGLGGFLQESFSFERDYDWYLDQANTGEFKDINCGPTSTVMAAKWADNSFSQTPVDARSAYRPEGGWWYTDDICHYLTDNGIPNTIVTLGNSVSATEQIIKSKLDEGYLAILCLDMYYISSNAIPENRVDKFYRTDWRDWGHFIVTKGYKVIDGNLFFEVNDPFNYGAKYHDGSLKGNNRYYRSKDVYAATKIWWNYTICVSEKNNTKSTLPGSLNLSEIEHKWGR